MSNSETIKMNIKPEAAARIKSHVKQDQIVLLALNDGSNQYSKLGGTCTIGANFQFVILDQKDPDFSIAINNNTDLSLFTSPAEMQYLDNNLVVSEKNATMSLADDSGVIDGAVSINEYQPSAVTKKDLEEGKTC
ncbi:iron-sulfur cluster biosynthesis family protein [Lactobacillus sp. ESL0701]|uniref:iron-sulfur cluster biosynthesis family protein n=1 Tax=Lactobacillus sp. ESL0701 TaxID=2983217 RepID=UPI0023F619DA|nr:iron-sulfur cluster biosynthesis family protein [Lactobacillus sp. ESL0701]MDF7672859.1 iron-sulfur cluster biosynthesis family protein [Lactobacillus sp. ESL0701]